MFVEKGSVERTRVFCMVMVWILRRFTGVCNTASGAHLALSVIIPMGEGGWKGQINLFAKLTRSMASFLGNLPCIWGTMEKETEAFSPENPD